MFQRYCLVKIHKNDAQVIIFVLFKYFWFCSMPSISVVNSKSIDFLLLCLNVSEHIVVSWKNLVD